MEKVDGSQPISTILNGSNYRLWVQSMRSFLKGRKLWRVVTGEIKEPKKGSAESDDKYTERLEDWDSKNHQIITWLRNTSIPSIHSQFGRYETAKEVWDLLEQRYTTSDLSCQYQLWEELYSLKQERGQSITSFLAKLETLWDQLSQSDPTFACDHDNKKFVEHRDRMRLIQFLMALTDDFESCRASLLHQNPLPTLESAVSRLLSDETRLGLHKPKQDDVVLATSTKNSYRGKSKYCSHCDKPGHTLSECSSVECRVCKKKGHIASYCPNVECNYCKQSSHSISRCPTAPPRASQHQNHPRTNQSSRPGLAAVASNEDSTVTSTPTTVGNLENLLKQILYASSSNSTALSTTSGNSPWLFDSGCCNHMTSQGSFFSTFLPDFNGPSIYTADGSQMQVSKCGKISTSTLTLPNTFFIPKLAFNLISVGQLCELGFELIFSANGCRVQDPQTGQTLGTGRKVGRLFELTSLHITSDHVSQLCAASTTSALQLWHLRLGHASISKLRPLISHGHLGSVKEESFHCVPCQVGKQPALSFNNSESISLAPFDLVHSDIWGPSPTPTMGGSKYFVLFIDDHTRFTWLYLMKKRSELPQIYIDFAKMIKTQFSQTIKVLRTDNALEYLDNKLQSFLKDQGTISQRSCPYTSQQNGRAERKHRHILDYVCSLLVSSSCPERFWGEAALTVAYVINRLPSAVIQNQSPYERLYGMTPSYDLLKIFGCACFVLLPSHEHIKLEPRARLCCFLGYVIEHKGYRCWDPVSQKLRVSRNVIFWEHTMFCSLSKFQVSDIDQVSFFTNPSIELFPCGNVENSGEITDALPMPPPQVDVSPADPAPAPTNSESQPLECSPSRSTRVRNPPTYLRDYHCFAALVSLYEPQSYKEACTNPLWQQAMQEELQALDKTHT